MTPSKGSATPRASSALGSCKYGAECGYVVGCECDCCLVVHECECEPEHGDMDDDDDIHEDRLP